MHNFQPIPVSNPIFSIIIPTYNRANLLPETLEKVFSQTFLNFECIVVDDGSTDSTQEILADIPDKRLKYVWKTNGERGAARNFGAKLAKGKYITFLDSDDILYPHHLQSALTFISSHNSPEIFFHAYELHKGNFKESVPINWTSSSLRQLAWMNVIVPSATFIRKHIFLQYPFDEDARFNLAEDLYVWMRIGARYPILFNPDITFGLNQHSGRSMAHPSPEKIHYCNNKLQNLLKEDKTFMDDYAHLLKMLKATHFSLEGLSHALKHNPALALKALYIAIQHNPKEIFRRRTLAIFKHIILSNTHETLDQQNLPQNSG